MQIKDNWDSVCSKIPSKRFHIFKPHFTPSHLPTNLMILRRTSKYSWSYVSSTGSRPDHITPNRTWMRKIYVDICRLSWQANLFRCVIMSWCAWLWGDMVLCWGPKSWDRVQKIPPVVEANTWDQLSIVEYPTSQVPKLKIWLSVGKSD